MSSKISYVLVLTVLLTLIVNGSPDPQQVTVTLNGSTIVVQTTGTGATISSTIPSTSTFPSTLPSTFSSTLQSTLSSTFPSIPTGTGAGAPPPKSTKSSVEPVPTPSPATTTSFATSLQLLPRTLYVIRLLAFVFELFLIIA
ncbi:hypothetical protein Glove_421g130 [Diversispora epigaea]|uniref:REJ domain-containing protein n=1 Tax=Diversispora epigaea TaxID=1348612 RepID=A0A397GZM0_9GLOM|nr:hypothetical protein Glove_421g130 [Diversispora epigaea]